MPVSGFVQWGSDIKGGSTDDKHKDWSEITGFSHNITQPAQATRSLEGGGYESEVIHDPFVVTMRQDCASPKLYEALHNGTHIPKVIIELLRPTGKAPMVYMRYTMTNVTLHSASTSATPDPNSNFPVDILSMDYSSMQWEYTKQDDTGSAKGTVATKVNLTKGAGAS
ncbi:MAG TPA: type VI secretion system tube protein Hcp [Bryobacteraceae bacterium]|jgi:type VI secretion system secreted protein Hcp